MPQTANHSAMLPADGAVRPVTRGGRPAARPFAGIIDPILVEEPAPHHFAGSVSRVLAESAWTWVVRDLCADVISAEAVASGSFGAADIEPVMAQVLARMREGLAAADADAEANRRLRVTLGRDDAAAAIPVLLAALRSRSLLGKAQAFGKATNTIADDTALAAAVQSMPLQDPPLAALLFHAAMGQIANPTRLITTVIRLAGNATEAGILRAGYGPVVDAALAHAQNQLHALQPSGPFADTDLICRSLDRFHRLVRSLTGYIEFSRGSRWSTIISALTKQISDRIEPRLKSVVPDLNLALRRGREGADRVDADGVLAAINGIYLLATIRDCRDSLALNALFDQAWSQSGQTLEVHLQRNLDLIRENPSDQATAARLEAGIKMAEIRFNPEYAETLRRARLAAERRN
jgi:hypothetical protein